MWGEFRQCLRHLFSSVSEDTLHVIAGLLSSSATTITVRMMKVEKQANLSDCGVLTIAIAHEICNERNTGSEESFACIWQHAWRLSSFLIFLMNPERDSLVLKAWPRLSCTVYPECHTVVALIGHSAMNAMFGIVRNGHTRWSLLFYSWSSVGLQNLSLISPLFTYHFHSYKWASYCWLLFTWRFELLSSTVYSWLTIPKYCVGVVLREEQSTGGKHVLYTNILF